MGVLDAFSMATSAVCVPGPIVVDTGGAFSRFGEIVIMLLIEVGSQDAMDAFRRHLSG